MSELQEQIKELLLRKYSKELKEVNKENPSLSVDYSDLGKLAEEFMETPDVFLHEGRQALKEILGKDAPKKAMLRIHGTSQIRIVNIRKLSTDDIFKFICIEGIVSEIQQPIVYAHNVAFRCKGEGCGKITYMEQKNPTIVVSPDECPFCGCTKLEKDEKHSEMIEYQVMLLQEKPETLSEGRTPYILECRLYGDITESTLPGQRVVIEGILSIENVTGVLYTTYMESVSITAVEIHEEVITTEKDIETFHKMATKKDICDILVQSIAPHIYGHDEIKRSLLWASVSGIQRTLRDGSKIKNLIHLLLIGDPGTGKSKLLQFMKLLGALYTSGEGVSGVGLTAAVVQEKGSWRLRAGALVLADQKICGIDELDKMKTDDRAKMHEVLSEQTVNINKAGINAFLNARVTVIAACNPEKGRFSKEKSIGEQVNLPASLLSRFDLIYVILDEPDMENDRLVADRICDLRTDPENVYKGVLPIDVLKKWLLYASSLIPEWTKEAREECQEYYLRIRGQSRDSVSIGNRHLEALLRMSEAEAKLNLSTVITEQHAKTVINIFDNAYRSIYTNPESGKLDVNYMTGEVHTEQEKQLQMLDIIRFIVHTRKIEAVDKQDIVPIALNVGMERSEVEDLLKKLEKKGDINQRNGKYTLIEDKIWDSPFYKKLQKDLGNNTE